MSRIHLATVCLAVLVTALTTAAASADTFSHGDWDAVLSEFVDARGRVDYRRLAADRATFDRYLRSIQRQSPDSHPDLFPSRDHELAYWINAYNAQVFAGVLEKGPDIDSVWGFFGTGVAFFRGMKIVLGGETTTLQKLEDDIIRERYGDPRIHAAINCASISCPRLPREVFTADELDRQLDAAMHEFVTAPQHIELDRDAEEVHLSKIFDWFEGDFLSWEEEQGNRSPSLLDYVNRNRGEAGKIPADYEVEFLDYDKGLNSQG